MQKYIYEGPVLLFDKCIDNNWHAETIAESEKRARCNFAYQYKNTHNFSYNARIVMPGKITKIERKEN
jgi:hypothetical protein